MAEYPEKSHELNVFMLCTIANHIRLKFIKIQITDSVFALRTQYIFGKEILLKNAFQMVQNWTLFEYIPIDVVHFDT